MLCKNWFAEIDARPPRPDLLTVCGTVTVGNPGVVPFLVEANPQGINPQILILHLFQVQLPGEWQQRVTPKTVRFDRIVEEGDPDFDTVEIHDNGQSIASIPIQKHR